MNLAAGPQSDAFDALAAHTLTAAIKGIPPQAGKIELGAVGRQGWNLLRGDLPFPLAVLSRSALEHNSRWMRAFIEPTSSPSHPMARRPWRLSSSAGRSRTAPGRSPSPPCSSSWSAGASASIAC